MYIVGMQKRKVPDRSLVSKRDAVNYSAAITAVTNTVNNIVNSVPSEPIQTARTILNEHIQRYEHKRLCNAVFQQDGEFSVIIPPTTSTRIKFDVRQVRCLDVYCDWINENAVGGDGGSIFRVSYPGWYQLSVNWKVAQMTAAYKTESITLELYVNDTLVNELDCKPTWVNIIGVYPGVYYHPIMSVQGTKECVYLTPDDYFDFRISYTQTAGGNSWDTSIEHYGYFDINLKEG